MMEMKSKKRFNNYPASKVHVAVRLFALVWFIANFFLMMYFILTQAVVEMST